MKKLFAYGGIAASLALIVFGIGSITAGALGVNDVRNNLAQEQIYFGKASDDPAVPAKYSEQQVTNGAQAREFAKMMRTHALEANGGLVYADMGRFVAKPGTPANVTDG